MITRLLGILTLLAALAGPQALAQAPLRSAAPECATQAAAGRWLHDPEGDTIGSVRALTDGGRSAVIMIGSYYQPGSHEAVVPACEITMTEGRLTLRHDTVEVLNTYPGADLAASASRDR